MSDKPYVNVDELSSGEEEKSPDPIDPAILPTPPEPFVPSTPLEPPRSAADLMRAAALARAGVGPPVATVAPPTIVAQPPRFQTVRPGPVTAGKVVVPASCLKKKIPIPLHLVQAQATSATAAPARQIGRTMKDSLTQLAWDMKHLKEGGIPWDACIADLQLVCQQLRLCISKLPTHPKPIVGEAPPGTEATTVETQLQVVSDRYEGLKMAVNNSNDLVLCNAAERFSEAVQHLATLQRAQAGRSRKKASETSDSSYVPDEEEESEETTDEEDSEFDETADTEEVEEEDDTTAPLAQTLPVRNTQSFVVDSSSSSDESYEPPRGRKRKTRRRE